jgi:hypothetical protein
VQNQTHKTLLAFLGFWLVLQTSAFAANYQYQLFKNQENFGIVVFPRENMFDGLSQYIQSIDFKEVESGDAVRSVNASGDFRKSHSVGKR